jgi:uncharacterized membrane protein
MGGVGECSYHTPISLIDKKLSKYSIEPLFVMLFIYRCSFILGWSTKFFCLEISRNIYFVFREIFISYFSKYLFRISRNIFYFAKFRIAKS